MKLRKDERGYALLIVLFLVVLIMTITAVFMRGALSNAKQEKIVDQNHLSHVAAEMGVEYYKTFYINGFESVKENLLDAFVAEFIAKKAAINSDKKGDVLNRVQIAHDDLRRKVAGELSEKLSELSTNEVEDVWFRIVKPDGLKWKDGNLDFTSDGFLSVVEGYVEGDYEGGNPTQLKMNLSFEVPDLNVESDSGSSGSTEFKITFPTITLNDFFSNNIPSSPCAGKINDKKIEGNGKRCKAAAGDKIEDVEKSEVLFSGAVATKELEVESKSNVYVNGALAITEEVEVESDSNLYVNGALTAKKLEVEEKSNAYVNGASSVSDEVEVEKHSNLYINGAFSGKKVLVKEKSLFYAAGAFSISDELKVDDKSTLYIGGAFSGTKVAVEKKSTVYVDKALTVTEDLEIDDKSTLYVGGAFNGKKVEVDEKSSLYVGGALTATSDLVVKDKSKVCVAGALTVTGKFKVEDKSIVYVLGIPNKYPEKSDNLRKLDTLKEFEEVCGATGIDGIYEWPDPVIDVVY